MSSYNNRIDTQNIPKEQQNAQKPVNIIQDTSIFNINKTNINFPKAQEQIQKKNKISYKTLIIIIVAIVAVITIVTLILVFTLRKKKKPSPIIRYNPGETIPSTIISDIITTVG